MAIGLDLKEKR